MKPQFDPLRFKFLNEEEMLERAREFSAELGRRRSVREFSSQSVPLQIIENCLAAAGTAPSGANRQPWHFVVVTDQKVKQKIRVAAEKEEREFYAHRAPQSWLDALAILGTDENKPFLETAPYLIAIFARRTEQLASGEELPNYYVTESVGIATGMLIAALHRAGLATLTHTPSPMRFLNEILGRPSNERCFLLLVVGYPSDGAKVPRIKRKPLDEIRTIV